MIFGIGVDVTETNRVTRLLNKYKYLFPERILAREELEFFKSINSSARQVEYLAGRFSAKESFVKAYGTGFGPITFQEIAILNKDNGQPFVLYSPFFGKSHVSISHTSELVFTEVVLEK